MRKVKCPRCSAIIPARGDVVKCVRCGLKGAVEEPRPLAPSKSVDGPEAKDAKGDKDPFVITLDLRKVSPKYWSRGTKVFAVLLILAGAFFLGGMAGVAFEKARTEISEDLDRGESLLGGGSSGANASGPSGTADTADDPVDEDPADTGDPTDVSDTNTSDDPQDNGTADPPQDPDPGPGDGGEPAGAPDPVEFEDLGSKKTAAFTVEYPLVTVGVDYFGGNPPLWLKMCRAGTDCVRGNLAASMSVDGEGVSRVFSVEPGEYYFDVDAQNAWYIILEQPRPSEGTPVPANKPGSGDQAVGPFEFAGSHEVVFTASGSSAEEIDVQAYTLDGDRVDGCSFYGFIPQDGPYETQVTCTVDGAALVYFDVVGPGENMSSQNSWNIEIHG